MFFLATACGQSPPFPDTGSPCCAPPSTTDTETTDTDTGTGAPPPALALAWRDADGDGDGDPLIYELREALDAGWVSTYSDCDDSDPSLNSIAGTCPVPDPPRYEIIANPPLRLFGEPRGFAVWAGTAGDLDGDGIVDLAVDTGELLVLHLGPWVGVNHGVYDADVILIHGGDLRQVSAAGDPDHDGDPDLLVLHNDVLALFATPLAGGTFDNGSADVVLTAEWGFWAAAPAGDPDGDGTDDVWVVDWKDLDLERYDVGLRPVPAEPEVVDVGTNGYTDLATADLDGDGVLEVVTSWSPKDANGYVDAGQVWVFSGDTAPTIDPLLDATSTFTGENFEAHVGISLSAGADLDGDGLADVMIGTDDGFHAAVFAPTPGTWRLAASADVLFLAPEYSWFIEPAGDVDGDGSADVVLPVRFNESFDLFVVHGPLTGTIDVEAQADQWSGSANLWGAEVGDLDGDGAPEALVTNWEEGDLYFLPM